MSGLNLNVHRNFKSLMQILASDFFSLEKDDKYVFKAKNSCCVGGTFSLKIHIFNVFRNKSDDYLYLYIKN